MWGSVAMAYDVLTSSPAKLQPARVLLRLAA
jgi:hypothetical protein